MSVSVCACVHMCVHMCDFTLAQVVFPLEGAVELMGRDRCVRWGLSMSEMLIVCPCLEVTQVLRQEVPEF